MTGIILAIIALVMICIVLFAIYKIIDKVGKVNSIEHTFTYGLFSDTFKINCNKADE